MANHPNPCRVRGVLYPSQTAAARALGVTKTTVGMALNRGAIDTIGLGKNSTLRTPIRVGGKSYRSQYEAASAHGIGYSNFKYLVHKAKLAGRGGKLPTPFGLLEVPL